MVTVIVRFWVQIQAPERIIKLNSIDLPDQF